MAQMTTSARPASLPGLWRRFWSRSNERVGYLFILPSLIHILAFLLVPLIFSFFLSFRDWTRPTFTDAPYIGLGNYEFLLGDRRFWQAMGNSAYYTALAVPLGMAFSLAIALVMNQKLRGVYLFRTLFFMPVVSSWVAVSIIWLTLLDPNVGIVNYVLSWFGLPAINWLGDPRSAMPAIVLIAIWKSAGFNMVIWLAGLQAIPKELYEAAAIDGAAVIARIDLRAVMALADQIHAYLEIGDELRTARLEDGKRIADMVVVAMRQ